MLKHKLKHMCARIISSLSAFGLVSFAMGDADGAIYEPGTSFKAYNVADNYSMTANMIEAVAENYCSVSNILSGYVAPGVELGSGDSAMYCSWSCPVGFFSDETFSSDKVTGDALGMEGGQIVGDYELKVGCRYVNGIQCVAADNASVSNNGPVSGQIDKAPCSFVCEEGYHIADSVDAEKCKNGGQECEEIVVPSAVSSVVEGGNTSYTYTMQAKCVPDNYKLTFACGDGAILPDGKNSREIDVTYMVPFSIPQDAYCEKQGYNFKGWKSNHEFEIQK